MDYGWQDRINDELRLLRRSESWERLSAEDQALRAGHLDRRSLSVGSFPARWMRGFRLMLGNMPAGRRYPKRAGVGEDGAHIDERSNRTRRGSRLTGHG